MSDWLLVDFFSAATVQGSFKLEKPVSELVKGIGRLEYDLYGEIGAPGSKVVFHVFGNISCKVL